jgi:hypothetical protein
MVIETVNQITDGELAIIDNEDRIVKDDVAMEVEAYSPEDPLPEVKVRFHPC